MNRTTSPRQPLAPLSITAPARRRPLAWPALLALALVGTGAWLATPAQAQTVIGTQQQAEVDPPGRVARLGYFDGNVSRLEAGEQDWAAAQLNYPITTGDRLATDSGGRAELHLGSTALRLAGGTQVEFATLDDDRAFLTVMQGTLSLRVRTLFPGQHLEVNTPNLALSITQPGEYRVDVDPAGGVTRVSVPSGGGVLYGENGQTQLVGAPQQIRFSGRNLAQAGAQNGVSRDGFDQWTLARDQQEEQSQSARYVSREVVGYQQLDSNGSWTEDPNLGAVWYPRTTVANWAPYRYGHWAWVAPWGWTWVDDAPWGFAPFHYGRWTQVGPRWGWVPGPRVPRPVYAPALVAFVGGSSGNVNWSLSIGGGQPGVAWFPLGPGEAYRPHYRASNTYITNINRTVVVNRNGPPGYRFQRPDTVTAIGAEDFRRGRPTRGDFQRVSQADLERARVINGPDLRPPPRQDRNDRRDDRRDDPRDNGRPGGGPPNVAQRPDARPDSRPDPRPDGRPDNRPDNRPDGWPGARPDFNRPGQPAPDLAEQQRRQIERAESRGSLTMEQRQQIQQQHDQQRRSLADQQQRQMQDGVLRQQQEQQERVRRQQQEQQDRVRGQQQEQQERLQRQQREQQERVQQQQRSQMNEGIERQRRAQDDMIQRRQQEMQARESQMQRDQQQRAQAEQQARQQQQQQAQQMQQMQAQQQAQQAQRQQQAQQQQQERAAREQQMQAQQREQAAREARGPRGPQGGGGDGPRPDRPRGPRGDGDGDGRPGPGRG